MSIDMIARGSLEVILLINPRYHFCSLSFPQFASKLIGRVICAVDLDCR